MTEAQATKVITIEAVTKELHKAYKLLNKKYFQNKLPMAAITIQSSAHQKLSMGWCSTKQIWGNREGSYTLYEINISAEYLDLDFYETMDTLMHEMVHLYNIVHDIQDCSRNGTYHNKHFKNQALAVGFEAKTSSPDKRYGWSFMKISEKTKQEVAKLRIDQSLFTMARKGARYYEALEEGADAEKETKKKSNSYKWVCPSCEVTVRSSKPEINILCGDCEETLICFTPNEKKP